MKKLSFYPYTKKFLAQVLGISTPTLNRYFNTHKAEILNEFPEYKPTDKRLHPNLFKSICYKNGISNEQIAEAIREAYPKFRNEAKERIYGFFGLGD